MFVHQKPTPPQTCGAFRDVITGKQREICKDFQLSAAWCVCPGESALIKTNTKRYRYYDRNTDSVEWATFPLEGGKQEKETSRSVAPNWGDYTENNVILLQAPASAHPKIADGLVTNIWFASTLYSAKSGGIFTGINLPFVLYFLKS